MGTQKLLAILLVGLLVLAGCAGPYGGDTDAGGTTTTAARTGTEPPVDSASTASVTTPSERSAGTGTPTTESEATASATPRPTVDVSGGTLPVNATKVWRRFQRFRDVGLPSHLTIQVQNVGTSRWISPNVPREKFASLFGVGPFETDPSGGEPGGAAWARSVSVFPNNGSAGEIEILLVHEFEHIAQDTTPKSPIFNAVREGGAVFVADRYGHRYELDVDHSASARSRYVNATSGGERYWAARYYFGYRYFDRRIDDPTNVTSVYRRPPETFEQLIHGLPAGTEPPKSLRIAGPAVGDGYRRTYGELFLRVALSTQVSRHEAARAATGWGNDRIAPLEEDPEGFVWAIRMDDERNASQLRSTIARYLDAKPNVTKTGDGSWRMENVSDHPGDEEVQYLYQGWNTDVLTLHVGRIGEETVSLLVGPPETVEDLTVTGTDENVTVANRNESSTPA